MNRVEIPDGTIRKNTEYGYLTGSLLNKEYEISSLSSLIFKCTYHILALMTEMLIAIL